MKQKTLPRSNFNYFTIVAFAAFFVIANMASAKKIIVYASDSTGNFEIYKKDISTGGTTRLTNNVADDREPALSTDGRWVAFASNRSGTYEIYKISVDTSELYGSPVFQITNNTADDREPDWSPKNWDAGYYQSVCYSKNGEIYVKSADGTGMEIAVTHNTHNSRPTWDVDGRHILYSHGQWSATLSNYIYNLHAVKLFYGPSASITTYYSATEDVLNSAETKNGDIAYMLMNTSGSPTSYEVWKLGGSASVASWLRQMSDIAYSPDGDSVFFCAKDVSQIYKIYKKSASGSGSTLKILDDGFNAQDMDYGEYIPDYEVAEIYPKPYTSISENKPQINFSLFGDGYIWSTMHITWMQKETFTPPASGVTYNSSAGRVTFDAEEAGVIDFPAVKDTIWVYAQIQAFTGTETITVDSIWWYINDTAATGLDAAIAASKAYANKMTDLYLSTEKARAMLKMANVVYDAASLLVVPTSASDRALTAVDYTTWSCPGDTTGNSVMGKVSGMPLGVTNILFDGLDMGLGIAGNYCRVRSEALHADPPDTAYTVLPFWLGDMDTTAFPQADDSLSVYIYYLIRKMSFNAELMRLVTSSVEKFSGAAAANEQQSMLMQAKGMKHASDLLEENSSSLDSTLRYIVSKMKSSGHNRYLDMQYIDSVKNRVTMNGLTDYEREGLLNAGLTNSQVDAVVDTLKNLNTTGIENQWLSAIFDSMRVNFAEGKIVFNSFSLELQHFMDSLTGNSIAVDSFPVAKAGGIYYCDEGVAVTLSASGSSDPLGSDLNYFWDMNGDGDFNDATGITANFPATTQLLYPVGLKIINSSGKTGYDYTWVLVKNIDNMPVITQSNPDSSFIVIEPNTQILFNVSAYDIEGHKSLSFQWTKDGIAVSTDTFYVYTFTSSDNGLVHVEVDINDGSPNSFITKKDWWVRVGPLTVNTQEYAKTVENFEVSNPYPNPAKSEISFTVTLDEPSSLIFQVNDITGRTVYSRNMDKLPAGKHLINWNGKINNGTNCPPGIYQGILKTTKDKESRKIVIIR